MSHDLPREGVLVDVTTKERVQIGPMGERNFGNYIMEKLSHGAPVTITPVDPLAEAEETAHRRFGDVPRKTTD